MIWLELLTALLAGVAAWAGCRLLGHRQAPQVPEPSATPEPEDARLQEGLVNLLSYELPQREEG